MTAEPLTGIDRALAATSDWDAANFRKAIEVWAAKGTAFTIEDVLEDTGVPIDHFNRIGALTRAAATAGVITRVGYTKAKRPSRAGSVVAVWIGIQ